jgi:hypothetical protein
MRITWGFRRNRSTAIIPHEYFTIRPNAHNKVVAVDTTEVYSTRCVIMLQRVRIE